MKPTTTTAGFRSLALVPALALLGGCIFSIHSRGSEWDGHHEHRHGGPTVVGSGIEREDQRYLDAFHAVEVSGSVTLELEIVPEQGPVVVRGDDNLLDYLRTDVQGGVLRIALEDGSYEPRRRLEVEVTCPSVDSLGLLGEGRIDASGLAGESLAVTLSGSGRVCVDGTVERLDVILNGSGDVELHELESRRARVILNGSGDVDLRVTEELEAKITGSGDVRYRGTPQVELAVHGSGSIRHR